MKLFVNDHPVDVQIHKGDDLNSLIQSLEKELDKDLFLSALAVDGDFVALSNEHALKQPLDSITKVEAQVTTKLEMTFELLTEAERFLTLSMREFRKGSLTDLHKKDIVSCLQWTVESLDAIRESLIFTPTILILTRASIARILIFLEEFYSEEALPVMGTSLEQNIRHLEELKYQLTQDSTQTMEEVLDKLSDLRKMLPQLASDFQQGRDLQALSRLAEILDHTELFIRLLSNDHRANMIESESKIITQLFGQMLEAFQNRDFVLLADLLEYDLDEALDGILEVLYDNSDTAH